jgi:hypothetical protein
VGQQVLWLSSEGSAEIVWAFVLLLVAVGPTVWKEDRTRKLREREKRLVGFFLLERERLLSVESRDSETRLRYETEIRETEKGGVFEEELMKAHWFCGLTEGPGKKK